jgi:serine/threonine protein kinase
MSAAEELTGAVLGRWTLEKRLGEGAMGPVYQAVSTGGTKGALHVVRPDLVAGADRLERLRRDAKTFQKVEHPNVPRLLDVDEARGHVFLTFEMIDGRSLQFRLDGKEPLSPAEGRNLATDLLTALATLHERGIIHGDVKPASVLTTPEGYWKLTGFSLAPKDDADAGATGVIRGTPLFMSPERCLGQPESVGSDLYSAGATIFAAVAGEAPFLRPSVAAILDAHVKDAPPDLEVKAPGINKDLRHLVEALMAKTAAKRPPDARTALAVLGRRTQPRAKTQLLRAPLEGAVGDAPVEAPPADASATLAGSPAEAAATAVDLPDATSKPPPGARTTRFMAHKVVLEEEHREGAKDPGSIPWGLAIVPIALAVFAGLVAVPAFPMPGAAGLPATARVALGVGSAALALLGVLLVVAGTVPAGLSHHAAARTLLARAPLRLAAWWNRRRDPVRAAAALARLGELAAGELLLEAGEPVLAAEEFMRAGIPLAAAIVFEKIGDGARATEAYVAAGKPEEAAAVATRQGKHEEAGQIFEDAGQLDRAIQAYARAGNPLKLAPVYERQGKHEEAAKQYELAKEPAKAAELYERAGLVADAARLFHRAGDLARVAAVWEAAGDQVNASRWRAERELAEGRQTNAAREFERAGLHGRAADLFLAQNLLTDAVRCAEADGDPARKALLHARLGDFARAARFHEEAGQHRDAARCFHELGDAAGEAHALELAGDPLAAADAWIRGDRLAEARQALAAVPREASDRKRALARLGELEARAGRPREAASALVEALEGEAPDATNVATIVECADALAACGEIDRAIERLSALQGLPFAPPTLRLRLAELEGKRRAAGTPVAASATRDGKDLVGLELDRYKTLTFVGEGEFSWAYEAEHTLLKRSADLRVLKPSLEEALAKRFFAEGAALAVARHRNLPDVYDSGRTTSGLSYVALEVTRDPSLRQLLRQAQGPLPVKRAAAIGADLLAGLATAHRAGIVHGDLRPENVLVGALDQARLVGFAFARHSTTLAPSAAGARAYASPEQTAGAAPDTTSDQYSCGVILYEMLAGAHPSGGRPLAQAAPGVPAPLAAAVMKALERRPENRHADAEALERIVGRFAVA